MLPTLKLLLDGKALDRAQARRAMGELMEGRATQAQIGAFLAALRLRGETFEELVGFAEALRERAVPVKVNRSPLLDTCGTGGDGGGTFNVSTTAAFIAAGAGAAVAKHGNRSVSSRCGSADVLEALGVKTEVAPEQAARCVEEAGVGFLFAPALHPAVRHAGPARKELGSRTVFNLLGPLVNPAGAKRQLLGVYAVSLVPVVARALQALGSEEALVVSSCDGLDEFSLLAPSRVAHLKDGKIREYEFDPSSLGLSRYPREAFAGGGAEDNAKILLGVLRGVKGAARDLSLLNGAAALIAAGLAGDFPEALEKAGESVDGGRALKALEDLKRLSHE
ncbi:MAG: anthranilate phosphoribosyltransferase [Elusimicrobiota bacterium]